MPFPLSMKHGFGVIVLVGVGVEVRVAVGVASGTVDVGVGVFVAVANGVIVGVGVMDCAESSGTYPKIRMKTRPSSRIRRDRRSAMVMGRLGSRASSATL